MLPNSPTDLRTTHRKAALGLLTTSGSRNGWLGGIWGNTRAQQIVSLNVDGATNSTTYTVGVSISQFGSVVSSTSLVVETDGGTSVAELEAALLAAAQGDLNVTEWLDVLDGTAAILFRAKHESVSFVLSESSGDLSQTTITAAGTAAAVEPGVLVGLRDGVANAHGSDLTFGPLSGVTAQVATLTAVYEAAAEYVTGITWRGQRYVTTTIGATDDAGTATAIAAAVNALMPAVSVVAAATTLGALTLTSEVPGETFKVDVTVGAAAATGTYVITSAPLLVTDDLMTYLAGVVGYRDVLDPLTVGTLLASWSVGQQISVLYAGGIWVPFSGGSTYTSGRVYVATATGVCYDAAGAGRVLLPAENARWNLANQPSDGFGNLILSLPLAAA